MSEFRAGFVSRHDAAAAALTAAFALPTGFEAIDPRERANGRVKPKSFTPQGEAGPRHFAPRDPDPADAETGQFDPGTFIDPITAAREAGYAEGFAAALAQAEADTDRDHMLAQAIGAALAGGDRLDRERIARQLRQTVMLLVSRLVGEAGVSGELLAARIDAAVELLADSAESALLRLHPADMPLIEGKLPKTLFPVADPAVARGSFVLESASTIVEDGPEQWLDQLAHAIDRVAMPK
ncbi:flagellar assembly protein FliH [Sphingomonas cannabina]|uniref:FliH/SctL family protein n=1 Tax=Sphingomonas cannabina TaxID=2899123 RepID=UPI001F2F1C8E|nr:FliH/SctL family protein [Sphingomonas cannabina]UIJ45436.1 flagellar assembly protein FliH [Sphingomonas cannabina]